MFDNECLHALELLEEKLVSEPVIVALDWSLAFEIKCDGSDNAIGAVLGQRKDKVFHTIYYARMILTKAQIN